MHNIPILELQSVEKHFPVARSRGFWSSRSHTNRVLKAVNKVSFSIFPGETMGLVGESGCGKSTVARLIAGLDSPNSGEILLNGKALPKKLSYKIQKAYRSGVEMIFQDPYASLDPRWRVKQIIAEPIKEYHLHHDRKEIYDNVNKLLTLVGLSPEDGEKYPHEFSGGQRQRISIARSLSSNPKLLICDEPTSALDVSIQAQILSLMRNLQCELGLTYLFISHNLAVVKHVSDFVGVMYLGKLCELASKDDLFRNPKHPYTKMLIETVPDLEVGARNGNSIRGEVPNPIDPPSGCPFHPRCPLALSKCRETAPTMQDSGGGHYVACWQA
ncbi:oligopeptide/dipeptide ABC transporter ATP-binding protein [Marispirochaeta aestuarii]|uniref:ABC transporter ATP-binding protein n=1 Tax=Marispirochaeta aestuarii TaxID=1963862 RepID=UPI0029C85FE4|nr:oligopeptide/dipeptide ABC transporter ATP-binding protein [Marispirochaeta aestuarii]